MLDTITGTMSFQIPCTLDLRTLTLNQLRRLHTEVQREAERRQLSPEDLSESLSKKKRRKKEAVTFEYIHKWEEWTRQISPREMKWTWHRKGKAWQMELTVIDEFGTPTKYSRWGKNKKATQKHLARMAWYRYLNGVEENDLEDEAQTQQSQHDGSNEQPELGPRDEYEEGP